MRDEIFSGESPISVDSGKRPNRRFKEGATPNCGDHMAMGSKIDLQGICKGVAEGVWGLHGVKMRDFQT